MNRPKPSVSQATEAALNFSFEPILERYKRDYGVDDETARRHELELKRYFILCATQDGRLGMRGPVDNIWHTFLLFTEEYADFCHRVAGRFLHHIPESHKGQSPEERLASAKNYGATLNAYREVFGTPAPSDLWPPVKSVEGARSQVTDSDPCVSTGCGAEACVITTCRPSCNEGGGGAASGGS
jgi:hypothetical protein